MRERSVLEFIPRTSATRRLPDATLRRSRERAFSHDRTARFQSNLRESSRC